MGNTMHIVKHYPIKSGKVSVNSVTHAKRYDVCLAAIVDDDTGKIVDVRFMGRALVATADGNKGFDVDCSVDFASATVRRIDTPARHVINGKAPSASEKPELSLIPFVND